MATRAATPWGPADLVEELTVQQQAGTKRFSSKVQLLETAKGERLVRFSYAGLRRHARAGDPQGAGHWTAESRPRQAPGARGDARVLVVTPASSSTLCPAAKRRTYRSNH